MLQRRLTFGLIVALASFVVLLAGCAPRAGAGEVAALVGEGGLVVDLPALVIEFDESGSASYGGVPLAQLAPGVADGLILTPQALEALKAANIQHIQINNRTDGLQVLVNGRTIPSIRWDGESLDATAAALKQLGAGAPLVEQLLPFVRNAGLAVVARFPLAADATAIPLMVESVDAAEAQQIQQQFLASVGDPPPTINIPVFYSANGSWTVSGMSADEYMALLPGVPWQALQLPPDLVAGAVQSGIQRIDIATQPEGIFIRINEQTLPHIDWQNGELTNLVALAVDAGLLDSLAGSGMDASNVQQILQQLLPVIQATDLNLMVHFPAE